MKVNLQRSTKGKSNYVFLISLAIVLGMVGVLLIETCPFDDVSLAPIPSQKETGMGLQSQPSSSIKWHKWPATAYSQSGNPLVFKGNSFFLQARELYLQPQPNGNTLLDEFLRVYKNRPDPVNICGIRINHALALFLAVKVINPTLVVESGVNAGVSTYFIRSASPSTKIYAIDPEEKPICGQGTRWIDEEGIRNKLTINYTGKENFKDLLDLDWAGMAKRNEIDPDTTLVSLDDHLHSLKRIAALMKVGIRHVLVEDNYKYGKGATPQDKKSTPKQMFFGPEWEREGNWLFHSIASYAEFPPLVPPWISKDITFELPEQRKKAGGFLLPNEQADDIMHPILRPDLTREDMEIFNHIAEVLGLQSSIREKSDYMQFMNYNQICHLELVPMPALLLE